MSFGSGFGSGFGSNNNQNQGGGFGFGASNNNNSTGFGTSTSNAGFGNTSTNTNPFGGAGFGTNTGGGFGSTNSNNNNGTSLFGAPKTGGFGTPASSSSNSLFGGTATTNNAFGGGNAFGSNASTGFGNTSTAGSGGFSFGAQNNTTKPAFGSNPSSTTLFGQGNSGTTTGFGSTSGFGGTTGAGTGTALNSQPVPPSEGTAVAPFAPTNEKDPAGSSTSSYQSISFMQPYQKYSFEELRLGDYNAGRRFGNGSGQAGAFGASSTFGGFGTNTNTNTGFGTSNSNPFGATSTSGSSGFGTTATSGFGGGSNSLFGAKPGGSNLFGSQPAASSSGSGLFGSSTATTGFGSNTGTNTGFGSTNTSSPFGSGQTQNKPGGLFSSNNAGSAGFSFGGNNTNPTSTPFGGSGTSNVFGTNNQPQQSSTFGGFGSQSQQAPSKPLFGSLTTSTQSQPSGGLFGTAPSNNPGGLFGTGNNTGQNPGGGLFGGGSNTSGSGLFGGNTGSKSLFNTPNNTVGSANQSVGSFGSQNQPQQQQPSLFGGNNNPAGLFGSNSANKPATGFSFGAPTSTNSQSTGLFGSMTNNNANTISGGNLFGNSQNIQQQSQQGGALHSSLLDGNPYGQSSIWTGLPSATSENSGPLVTPLTASQRLKESQAKPPSFKIQSPRIMTPPRRQGFGISYSTIGSQNSVTSTPGGSGLTSSMYGKSFTGGSFGRSMGKSFSATNLRQQFAADGESILSPGAFAPGSSRHSGGSIRRLTIDRSLKTDLFKRPELPAPPISNAPTDEPTTNGDTPQEPQSGKLKKRVSFDKETTRGGTTHEELNAVNGALVRTENDDSEPTAEEQGFLRSSRRSKGASGSSAGAPEMEHTRANDLAVVPEDRESDNVPPKASATGALAIPDPKPGEYWMKPSRAEIRKMPREKLQHFRGYEVGRHGCGHVTFDGPVDLTTLPLDDVYDKFVEIRLRSITVYPDANTKPPMGKGLNVPSTLRLENSWPRSRNIPSSATSGPLFDKHVMRLKKMTGTQFVKYDTQTGVWTFRVPHFTRYGLDYDEEDEPLDESTLSAPPDSLLESPQPGSSRASAMEVEDDTPEESSPEDDTFAFKQKSIPGGFGRRPFIEHEQGESLLGDGSAGAPSESEHSENSEAEDSDAARGMAGSFPQNTGAAEQHNDNTGRPILKASQWGTPGKALLDLEGDWAEQLQRTISPRKQNREALREAQGKVLMDRVHEPTKQRVLSNKKEFRTSIDVMNSLFGQHEERMAPGRKKQAIGPVFEWPYSKRAKTFDANSNDLNASDQAWHATFKPRWTATGSLLYAHGGMTAPDTRQAWDWQDERLIVGDGRDIIESSLQGDGKDPYTDQDAGWRNALISLVEGVPFARPKNLPFSAFCDEIVRRDKEISPKENWIEGLAASKKLSDTTLSGIEMEVYQLAHVLFDDYDDQYSAGLTQHQKKDFAGRIRKDRLSSFLTSRIAEKHIKDMQAIPSTDHETVALLHLSMGDSAGASDRLIAGKNYHLATLISQIQHADDAFQADMESQLADWRQQSIMSEISEPIRAIYELLAGNTTISTGKSDGPLEDRASTFAISKRFGFDWMQAFGLSFWYGKKKHGTIEDVVRDYASKVASQEESAVPLPDGSLSGESPLWVLLKIFAYQSDPGRESPILPQALNSLSKPFDSGVTFQLHHTLVAHIFHLRVDTARADQLATDLAFQRSAAGSYFDAIFALMHTSNAAEREASIKDLLTRHASHLPEAPENPKDVGEVSWTALTKHLKIPKQWICGAKALYARSQNLSIQELKYLLAAEQWNRAHECLCRRVAPRAIIDEDWQVLRDMVDKFKGKEDHIPDWIHGGGMYHDFVDLRAAHKVGHKDSTARVRRLQAELTAHGQKFKKHASGVVSRGMEELEERVACKEMARLVAELAGREKDVQKKMIVDLPLTTDARLSHTKEMSVSYYRAAMAAAR